jgi:hypothetical protein
VFAVEELKTFYVDRNARDFKQQNLLIVAACNNGTAVAIKSLFYDDDFAIFNNSADGATEVSNNDMQIDIRSSVFVDAADELGNTALHY